MIMIGAMYKTHHKWMMLILLQAAFCITLVSSFSCDDYSGGQYSSHFCMSQACRSYCAKQPNPESCMDLNYIRPGYCKRKVPPYICFALQIWEQLCLPCPSPQGGICLPFGGTPCFPTWDDCMHQATPIICWAKSNVVPGLCEQCPFPVADVCPNFDFNLCYASKEACDQAPSAPKDTCWADPGFAKDQCLECPVHVGGVCSSFGDAKCYPSKSECDHGKTTCWAAKSWVDPTCEICPDPRQNQCPSFGWTRCYPTKLDCIDGASGGANCKNTCRNNTLGLNRPKFSGPSCYNNHYGPQFGENWVPTGKTRFEKYIPNVTTLYKVLQTTNDDLPWLKTKWIKNSWDLMGCDAAAAVYEGVVCAIEILDVLNKTFVGPKSGAPGNKITDFLNNGDAQVDLRELGAFVSQSWKETARMQVWEETPSTAYRDCTIYPCGKSLYYQGRGPVQLSWNYNYGPFSEWFYGDKFVLLDDPDKVDSEGPMGFIAYFWFWFTPRDFTSGFPISGSIRMRDAIVHWTDNKMNGIYRDGKDYDKYAGLGLSTNVVNGGVECSPGSDGPLWRIIYYLTAAGRLGAKLPDMNDENACRQDKYCNGLFSGCSASSKGATCDPVINSCGPTYVIGWQGKLCKNRSSDQPAIQM